jgi:short-subunit dehydrogenase
MMELSRKTIVITGASKGLGREISIRLGTQGANLILVARTELRLLEVQEQLAQQTGRVPFIVPCDVTSESDVSQLAAVIQERYQQVDGLVNNAGLGIFRPSEKLSNEEMRQHFQVNFFGAYYCIKALFPLIRASKSGYILNIGSLFSRVSLAENSVYAATKFALAGFTEGLRREMKPYGIGVGLLLPGPMATSFRQGRSGQMARSPLMLDPQQTAKVVETMLRRRQKTVIEPVWMLPILRLRYLFA